MSILNSAKKKLFDKIDDRDLVKQQKSLFFPHAQPKT